MINFARPFCFRIPYLQLNSLLSMRKFSLIVLPQQNSNLQNSNLHKQLLAVKKLKQMLTSDSLYDGWEFANALENAALRPLKPANLFLGDPQAGHSVYPFSHLALQEDTLDYGTTGELVDQDGDLFTDSGMSVPVAPTFGNGVLEKCVNEGVGAVVFADDLHIHRDKSFTGEISVKNAPLLILSLGQLICYQHCRKLSLI